MPEIINIDCKTPATIADTLAKTICVQRTNSSTVRLTILGILSGATSASERLSPRLYQATRGHVGFGLAKMITGAVFSVGLMITVIAGAELFTGNNLMFMGTLDKNVPLKTLLKSWVIVLVANFVVQCFWPL